MPNDNHIKIFIAYSREDKDILDELRKNLVVLERTQDIDVWYDGEIEAGANWENAIKENLHSADIILLLISQNFIASDHSYDNEMAQALALHQTGKVKVIPVIARECLWQDTPFSRLQPLPPDGKPITSNSWENPNRPYFLVANAIKDQVNRIRKTKKGVLNKPKPEIHIERPDTSVNPPVASGSFFQSKGFKYGLPILLLALFALWFAPTLFSKKQNIDNTQLAVAQGVFNYHMEEGKNYFFQNDYNNAKDHFEQAVKTGQEYSFSPKEARQFIKKCNDELEKIKREQTFDVKNKNYNEWKVKGDKEFEFKRYKTALEYYNRARNYMETDYIERKIKECHAKLNDGQSPGGISPGKFTLDLDPKLLKSIQKSSINKSATIDTSALKKVFSRTRQ